MEWVFIVGLGFWVWLQGQHIETLSRRLQALEGPVAAPRATPAQREPLILDTPLRPGELEPLLLDTPLPEASNDPAPKAARPRIAASQAKAAPKAPERRIERWLAENGIAWLGGGAIALAGIFLFDFAAKQNWFTPQVRLICALLLGAAFLGASEWGRRVARVSPLGNKLVTALLAGAGASTFYAAAWAMHGIYHYIDWPAAAALLALCALLLVGLSFLHGQALGILALIAALLTPPLTSLGAWPEAALTLYLCAISGAGFSLAILRRWPWATLATLAGLYCWFAASIAADEIWRALTLLCFASVGGLALALRAAIAEDAKAQLSWRHVHALGPSIALSVSSVLLIWTWLASGRVVGPALIGVFHVALAAYALRARVAAAPSLVVAIAALVLGFAAYLGIDYYAAPFADEKYPALLLAAFAIAICAFAARPHRSERTLIAGASALGAATLTALAALSRSEWHSLAAWAALFAGAALLFAAAWRSAGEAQKPESDTATDLWVGAAAALTFLCIDAAFSDLLRGTADAGVALLFALGFAQFGWRALGYGALSAAALALGNAFSPPLLGAAWAGALPLWQALTLLGASAALLFAAARFALRRSAPSLTSEALNSAAVFALLIAMLLTLHWIAMGGVGAPLDDFMEASLRTLALLAAGHVVMPRAGQKLSHIGQWRGHVLMAAGLAYALLGPALGLNPWWGAAPAMIPGPPLFNALALGLAAPAVIALATAARLHAGHKQLTRLYAAAGGTLALVWLVLEIRHFFQGAQMHGSGFIGLEGFAHTLWPLALVLAASALNARADKPYRAELEKIAALAAWPALGLAGLGLWIVFSPWWGLTPAHADSWLAALIGGGAFVFAAWASAAATRLPQVPWSQHFAQAASIACVMHLFVAATLAVRRLYHSSDISAAATGSVEMWTYSAVWALFGAGVFALGTRRADALLRWCGLVLLLVATAKVFLFDMAQLAGVIRVGSFLGLGVVLLAIAWGARRFSTTPLSPAVQRETPHDRR